MYDYDEHETFDSEGRLSPFSECLEMLRRHQEHYKLRINYLEKENERITDEHFKDEYVRKANESIEIIRADMMRGFPITEEEQADITKWQEQHIIECHPKAANNPNYFGPAGGNWIYCFTPTTIGILGEVKCYCGAKHIFSSFD